jgi:membrane associated rhomboid family serine protease
MFIPWGTDAPIYHWPWMTVVLIVTNFLVFFGVMNLPEETVTPLLLAHGQGLHPLQWLTSNFIHANFEHLIGNMMFLWAFALVVEGKLGAFPFLGVYLGLGITQCGLEQALTLGMEEGASFGASAIIYGVMTMALVWAPKNDLNCIAFFRFAPWAFEVPILVFALLYLALEGILVLFTGFALSSALLHLSGAALGFVLATVMVKKDWVDCENWDLFAVMQGRQGRSTREAARQRHAPAPAPVAKKKAKASRAGRASDAPRSMEDQSAAALRRLRGHLDAGETEAAFGCYDKAVRTIPGWQPPGPDWLALIKALNVAKLWPASVSVMEAYLRRAPDPTARVRLKLAQILIREQQRPAHALRVLAEIPETGLPATLAPLRAELTRQAEQMREEGVLELEGEAW